jgi:hypothetical protein
MFHLFISKDEFLVISLFDRQKKNYLKLEIVVFNYIIDGFYTQI